MAASTHISAQQHSATFTDRQRTIALVVVALGFVMDLLDSTIVNVAIPTIQTNLHATYATIQWLLAGYSLTFALLLITGGRMGDVFGYKKLFMIGMAGFTVASLLSGVSVNSSMLIFARLLQGSMAALMVPQVFSLMQVMYKPEERASINGLFGALGGTAASLGPVIGGILIRLNIAHLDWRPVFLINVPVGIFGLLAAQKYLPKGKSEHPLKLDLVGTGIVIVAMSLLIYPLIEGRQLGWPTWSYIMMIASLPAFAIFARWQVVKMRRDGSPLVTPALFHRQSFNAGLLINMLFEAATLGFFLTFTLVIQIGLGFTPIHAALTGLPIAIGIALTMATLGEKVLPKLGRRAMMLGCVLLSLGLLVTYEVFHRYGVAVHSWQLIGGLLLIGIAMGCVFASLFAAVLNGVDVKHAGAASGILNAVQQVGGAVGVALVGVVFFGQISHHAPASFDSVKPQLVASLQAEHVPAAAQASIISGTQDCFIDRSQEKDSSVVPASCKQTGSDPKLAAVITKTADKANATNFSNAFHAAAIFSIIVLVLIFTLSFALPSHVNPETVPQV